MAKKRKRGIKASKIKLAEALHACGLSTQIALAEKIADMEGTDLVPRDLVSRAFREQPIEFTSLARIAAALGVEAHTLFLVEETSNNDEGDAAALVTPASKPKPDYFLPGLVLTAVLLIVTGAFLLQSDKGKALPWKSLEPRLNTYSLALLSNGNELEQLLVNSLNKELSTQYNVSSPAISSITSNSNPEFVAERFGADAVLTLRMQQQGRLLAIQYFLYANKIQEAMRVDFYSEDEIRNSLEHIATHFTDTLKAIINNKTFNAPPSLYAQNEYLAGMEMMDAPYSDFAYTKAQLHFRNALIQAPNFAEAHAGLCSSLTDASWNGDSAEMLQRAKTHCEKARELDPNNLRVLLAAGNFRLKSGDSEGAKSYFKQSFATFAGNNGAEEGLATVALQEYVATGERYFLDQGEEHSRLALQYAHRSWSARFIYGNLLFYQGRIEEALVEWQQAAEFRPHEVLLHNVGTASFCMDRLDIAEESYKKTQLFNQQSYVGDEALGKIYYYRSDFLTATELQRRALDKLGDDANIHQMWASLADSWRHTGNDSAALDAYKKALEVIEKDLLLGIAEHGNALHRQYYLLRMKEIDPRTVTDAALKTWEIPETVAEGQKLTASEQVRLAQLYALSGQVAKAVAVWEKAAQTCPVYLKNPELLQLLGETHLLQAGNP